MRWTMSGLVTVLLLLAAACGGGDATPPATTEAPAGTEASEPGVVATTSAPAAAADDEDDPLAVRRVAASDRPTVVFDGSECLYVGPEFVEEGPVRLSLDNESELRARLEVSKLADGKTWDDVLVFASSAEAVTGVLPDWIVQSRKVRATGGREVTVTRALEGGKLRPCLLHRGFGAVRRSGGRTLRGPR